MKPARSLTILFFTALLTTSSARTNTTDEQVSPQQVATLIGIDKALAECESLHCYDLQPKTATLQKVLLRKQITDAAVAASLDVNSVLAEIANEHARLLELCSVLQGKRDRAVVLASTANLVAGTGIGIAVNALQFKNSTALLGDGIGVGSGVASTILSIIGIRLQNGPKQGVMHSPNMLAKLLGREPVLHSEYPDTVLAYLNSVPVSESPADGSRLDQLRKEWQRTGKLGPEGTPRSEKKIDL